MKCWVFPDSQQGFFGVHICNYRYKHSNLSCQIKTSISKQHKAGGEKPHTFVFCNKKCTALHDPRCMLKDTSAWSVDWKFLEMKGGIKVFINTWEKHLPKASPFQPFLTISLSNWKSPSHFDSLPVRHCTLFTTLQCLVCSKMQHAWPAILLRKQDTLILDIAFSRAPGCFGDSRENFTSLCNCLPSR